MLAIQSLTHVFEGLELLLSRFRTLSKQWFIWRMENKTYHINDANPLQKLLPFSSKPSLRH